MYSRKRSNTLFFKKQAMYHVLIMYHDMSVLLEIFEIGSRVIAADSTQAAVIW